MSKPLGSHQGIGGTRQIVHVESGFAYGVIDADLHVFRDRGPIYLLTEYSPSTEPDSAWLIAQPSRLLNARWQVVKFTGRERELADLIAWRDRVGSRFAARWLYAPGGQGKTRLAAKLADDSRSAGWKVINIVHGTDARPPGSHDMGMAGARGLLLIADYADRWPISHLKWLLSNSIFHQHAPTRLLLLSRTIQPWPPIRAILGDLRADTSSNLLDPLTPDLDHDRERMFNTAHACFASRYGLPDPGAIRGPARFSGPEYGLTLALHMAALVGVDAYVHGLRVPDDLASLSSYLLDKEHRHWVQLYESRLEGANFDTPPHLMGRSVFAAILTGPTPYPEGVSIVRRLEVEDADQVLSDHAACYPPTHPAAVLEPLYPDRLAEDFIALAIPGHTVYAHPASSWAIPALQGLTSHESQGFPPVNIARTITLLTSAATRWPHVVDHLAEVLRADPGQALRAGSAVLAALAALDDIDLELLEAIAGHFPQKHFDLALGIAAIFSRLAPYRIEKAEDAAERARVYDNLAHRLADAGQHHEALSATERAVESWRRRAGRNSSHDDALASSLTNLGNRLHLLGRAQDAIPALKNAVEVRRRLASRDFKYQASLASSLRVLGSNLSAQGFKSEALAVTQESVDILRRAVMDDPAAQISSLAASLNNLGNRLSESGRMSEALAVTEQAVAVRRRLAAEDEHANAPDLAMSLYNLGRDFWKAGRREESLKASLQAVSIYNRLAGSNPAKYEPLHALALREFGARLRDMGRYKDALTQTREAVAIWKRLAQTHPSSYEPHLAGALVDLGGFLAAAGKWNDAVSASEEALIIRRRLLEVGSPTDEITLGKTLINLGADLCGAGRVDAAIGPTEEAVVILRQVARSNPEEVNPALAAALENLGQILFQANRLQDAVSVAKESITLYRHLASRDPNEYVPSLERILEFVKKCEPPAG